LTQLRQMAKCYNCKIEYPWWRKGTYCAKCGYMIGYAPDGQNLDEYFERYGWLKFFALIGGLVVLILFPLFMIIQVDTGSWDIFLAFPVILLVIVLLVLLVFFKPRKLR
jgi:hypothetical protein